MGGGEARDDWAAVVVDKSIDKAFCRQPESCT